MLRNWPAVNAGDLSIKKGEVRHVLYDAFGLIGTTFRELGWKTLIFFERLVPISPNAHLRRRAPQVVVVLSKGEPLGSESWWEGYVVDELADTAEAEAAAPRGVFPAFCVQELPAEQP